MTDGNGVIVFRMTVPFWKKVLAVTLFVGIMTTIGVAVRDFANAAPIEVVAVLDALMVGLAGGFLLGDRHGRRNP